MVLASNPRAAAGFGLLELVVVLAVAGLLAVLAWPSHADSVRKGRRADALRAATAVQQAQERWRGNQRRYAGQLADLGLAATSPGGHYGLALSAADAQGYTLTISALAGKPQAADAGCTVLTVVVSRGQASLGPPACWSA